MAKTTSHFEKENLEKASTKKMNLLKSPPPSPNKDESVPPFVTTLLQTIQFEIPPLVLSTKIKIKKGAAPNNIAAPYGFTHNDLSDLPTKPNT